jgi:hypothetical protein
LGNEKTPITRPVPMNCREFRSKHAAYVDDTLSGVDLDAMALHRQFCERCSQLDTRVRRALLVARNLPTIQPSAAFSQRLQARLDAERNTGELLRHARDPLASLGRSPVPGRYAVLLTGILMVAGVAGLLTATSAREDVIRMAPVVASVPEADASPMATPTMVASVSAGMPMWPAVFVAQQAPWHFTSDAASR